MASESKPTSTPGDGDTLREWAEWTLETDGIHPMLEAVCRRYIDLEEQHAELEKVVREYEKRLGIPSFASTVGVSDA